MLSRGLLFRAFTPTHQNATAGEGTHRTRHSVGECTAEAAGAQLWVGRVDPAGRQHPRRSATPTVLAFALITSALVLGSPAIAHAAADLAVQAVNVTSGATYNTGDSVTVSAQIRNLGDVASPSYRLTFYASTNTTISTSDYEMFYTDSSALNAGATRTTTLIRALPSSVPSGTFYVGALLTVTDPNAGNDWNYDPSPQITVTAADLSVQSVNVSSGSTYNSGDLMTVSAQIRNIGGVTSPSYRLTFYASTNTTISTADHELFFTDSSALGAGVTRTTTITRAVPASVPSGTYYIGALLTVDDGTPTNNFNYDPSPQVTITAADLAVQSVNVTSGSTYNSGDMISITTQVRNVGGLTSPGYRLTYYASTNTTITSGDHELFFTDSSALGAGVLRTHTITRAIPAFVPSGTYYIGALLTVDDAVPGNNANYDPSPQVTIAAADLEVQSVNVTTGSVYNSGDPISVTAQVRNVGDLVSPGYRITYYASTNTLITAGDHELFHSDSSALSAGVLRTHTRSGPLPPSVPSGTYYIGALVTVDDANAGNNYNHDPSPQVTVTATADLAVQSVDVTSGASYAPGDTISIANVTENVGLATSSSYRITFYASTNTTISTSDYELFFSERSALAPGGSHSSTLSGPIPASVPDGTYYIGALLTVSDAITSNNTNYDPTPQVTLTTPPADLAVQSVNVTSGASYAPGDTISIANVTENIGGLASSTYRITFYASTNTIISASDHELFFSERSALAPGGTHSSTLSGPIPMTVPDGAYYIGALLTVTDANAANNSNYDPSPQVTIALPPADLSVELIDVTSGATYAPGDPISIANSVTNLGGVTSPSYRITFYASTNTTISTADYELFFRDRSPLGPGTPINAQSNGTIPVTVPDGTYYIGALLTVSDANASNNTNYDPSPQITVATPLPDLELQSVVVTSAGPYSGGSAVTADSLTANVGAGDASSYTLTLYASVDAAITAGDTVLGTHPMSPLAAGASITSGLTGTLPDPFAPGTYYVGAIVTGGGDTTPANNVAAGGTITVQPAACGPDGFEPDNDFGQATVLVPGISAAHTICPVADADWFEFTVSGRSGVVVETVNSTGDTLLVLYDGELREITRDDNGGVGALSRIERVCGVDDLPAGTYFVEVREAGDAAEIDGYDLTLTVAPPCLLVPRAIEFITPPPATAAGGTPFDVEWRLVGFGGPVSENRAYFGIRSVLGNSDAKATVNGPQTHTFTAPNVGAFHAPVTYVYVGAAMDGATQVVGPLATTVVTLGAAPPTVAWVTPPPATVPSGGTFDVEWQLGNFEAPATLNQVGWGITSIVASTCDQPGGNGTYTCTVPVPVVGGSGTLYYTAYADNGIEFAFAAVTSVTITVP